MLTLNKFSFLTGICINFAIQTRQLTSAQFPAPFPRVHVLHLKERDAIEGELHIVDSEVEIRTTHFQTTKDRIRLECNSSSPVEWIFVGPFYDHDRAPGRVHQ